MSNLILSKTPWVEWSLKSVLENGIFGIVYCAFRVDNKSTNLAAIRHISVPASQEEIEVVVDKGINSDTNSLNVFFDSVSDEYVNEISAICQAKDSNIVLYEDVKKQKKINGIGFDVFIRTELLQSLTEHLKSRVIDDSEIVHIGTDICTAISRCRAKGIIHKEISPSNIFVTDTKNYKLGNFEVSVINPETNQTRQFFYAPELFTDEPVFNEQTEVYALGITLYCLLNNDLYPLITAYSKDDKDAAELSNARRIKGERIPAPANGSSKLQEIVLKAIEYLPENRYKTAEEFKNALINYDKDTEPATKPDALPVTSKREDSEINKNSNDIDISHSQSPVSNIPVANALLMDKPVTAAPVAKAPAMNNQAVKVSVDNSTIMDTPNANVPVPNSLLMVKRKQDTQLPINFQVTQHQEKTKEKRQKINKYVVSAVAIIFFLVLTVWNIIPYLRYNRATNLMKDHSYSDAYDIFDSLGDYKDSKEMAIEVLYQKALYLASNTKYKEASEIFESLHNYKDSKEQYVEARYQYGLKLMEENNWKYAIDVFSDLQDYKEGNEKYQEARYQNALNMMATSQWEKAASLFDDLGKYKDSESQRNEAYYQMAIELVEQEEYEDAVFWFTELGSYKKSKNKANDAKYRYVLANKNNTDTTTYEYLKALKNANYMDSKKIYNSLYAWKIINIYFNSDEDDTNKYSSISKYDPVYCHFEVSGGPPNGSTYIYSTDIFPDGSSNEKNKSSEKYRLGDTISWGWSDGIYYDPAYGETGTLTMRFYDESGNLLGKGSVNITW